MLTVDCGNSTIRCRKPSGELWTTASSEPDVDGLRQFASGCRRAAIVSVVPRALQSVKSVLLPIGVHVDVVGEHLHCPLKLAYDTVDTLGADRWLGAFAAHRRFGAAVTVDCGTATTINFVDADGTFRGGAIAPGLASMGRGLRADAPALPVADLDARPELPARTTQSCVDAGVVIGWVGLVEKLVAEVAARELASDGRGDVGAATIVVTGGQAERLLRRTRLRCEHVPMLLHDGLAALAEARP